MARYYAAYDIVSFWSCSTDEIVGRLVQEHGFSSELTQTSAWVEEIEILKSYLKGLEGKLYFEFAIPRMGRRIDVVMVLRGSVFVIEFKVGSDKFDAAAIEQVVDYGLDLKNFHETSHSSWIAPILICTSAPNSKFQVQQSAHEDGLLLPICISGDQLPEVINAVLNFTGEVSMNPEEWQQGRYSPTPTIIEAAKALYRDHGVHEITRSEAGATNLSKTAKAIDRIIEHCRSNSKRAICFVTGVPGAGKTLVGLNVATNHLDPESETYSVFLSGNGPLVDVLREALARDHVQQVRDLGEKLQLGRARSEVKAFIQNVHHFRDECLTDSNRPPREHVALFDEAQRAWNLEQTAKFMKQKKNRPGFTQSEPDFLISCMDRHNDWSVVVCLVGGGQEINTGEAGIAEWLHAIKNKFGAWNIHIAPNLTDTEFSVEDILQDREFSDRVRFDPDLHLGVSIRSFRSERVSEFVKVLLDMDKVKASATFESLRDRFPIRLTRSMATAKQWLRSQARGSERYGILVSSQAERLKPQSIFVKAPMNHVNWFLNGKDDVRSSYYLEDVATEFHVQGLELDWACIAWDADFRLGNGGWDNWSFKGNEWQRIKAEDRKLYQKNAYRVLLTRARQGMIIVIPQGDPEDHTRLPEFYDPIFDYLVEVGIPVIGS